MKAPVILDHRHRPLRKRELTREVAGPGRLRSILRQTQTSGMDAERLGSLLREAEIPGSGGAVAFLELAEHMEEVDLHYFGVLATRKIGIAQLGIQVEPASDAAADVADADLVRSFLSRRSRVDEVVDILDGLGKGFSATEIVWETSERQWMPARLEWRDPRWFDFDRATGRRLALRWDDAPLPPGKFVVHVPRVKTGLPLRGGLARIAAWSWLFKSYALADWVRFLRGYGTPVRLGKYGPSATEDDIDVLERAVANVARDAGAVIPESMLIEIIEDSTVRGRSEIFGEFVAYIDRQLSVAILGQTLTTESTGAGSYALGKVHSLVRQDIEASDAAQLAETLERDVAVPMVQLNHGPRERYPRVIIGRPPAHDGKKIADVLSALVPLGLRVREADVRERLGWDAPEDDEVLRPPGPPLAVRRARADDIEQVVDAIDAGVWERLERPILDPVLALAKADPDAFADRLLAVWPDMDESALRERLARALFVADAVGRLDAEG